MMLTRKIDKMNIPLAGGHLATIKVVDTFTSYNVMLCIHREMKLIDGTLTESPLYSVSEYTTGLSVGIKPCKGIAEARFKASFKVEMNRHIIKSKIDSFPKVNTI